MEILIERELIKLAKASAKTETKAPASKAITMDDLLAGSETKHLKTGDVIEGVVTSVKKHEVWVDMGLTA